MVQQNYKTIKYAFKELVVETNKNMILFLRFSIFRPMNYLIFSFN